MTHGEGTRIKISISIAKITSTIIHIITPIMVYYWFKYPLFQLFGGKHTGYISTLKHQLPLTTKNAFNKNNSTFGIYSEECFSKIKTIYACRLFYSHG
jgi:hypothetical protein